MARYTDEQRALVKHLLDSTDGNVKATARESGVPEQTVRDWKKKWEREGAPEEVRAALPAAVDEFVDNTKRVRDKALDRLERTIDDPTSKIAAKDLATTVGILTDKVRVSEGKPTSLTENSGSGLGALPVEQVRELFTGMAKGMIEAVAQRRQTISSALDEEDIIEGEFTEQAPEALPAPPSE